VGSKWQLGMDGGGGEKSPSWALGGQGKEYSLEERKEELKSFAYKKRGVEGGEGTKERDKGKKKGGECLENPTKKVRLTHAYPLLGSKAWGGGKNAKRGKCPGSPANLGGP